MKKLILCLLLNFPVYAQAQLGVFGNIIEDVTSTSAKNTEVALYITTGSQALNVNSISFYYSTGTVGSNMELGIVSAPTATTQGTSIVTNCRATFTSAGTTNAVLTGSLTGCTLSAYTNYWLYFNNNDNSGSSVGKNDCGSTCTGAVGTATYGSCSVAQTYGATSGLTASFSTCPATQQRMIYITTTPLNNSSIGQLGRGGIF